MLKLEVVVAFALLWGSVVAQPTNSNVEYIEEDAIVEKRTTGNSMLSDIANEIIRRSSGSSQVLNLNLSNLLLLLVLKAVVYGAGYIGNQAFKGRGDVVGDNILSEGEAALALGYLVGDTCLYKAACEVPHTAKEYLGAAEIVFQAAKFMPKLIPINDLYKVMMVELQKAIDLGLKDQCPSYYSCKKENISRFLQPQ